MEKRVLNTPQPGVSGVGRGQGSSHPRNPAPNTKHNRLMERILNDPMKMAHINVEINKMTKIDLVEQLKELKIDSRGKKDVVRKRFKNYVRRNRAMAIAKNMEGKTPNPDRFFDYLIVIDFECTCEDGVYDYAHEIIEFPAVLVRTKDLEIVDIFHSYVKPKLNAELAAFCTELTGITQQQVDEARPFIDVLDDFRFWLSANDLGTKHRYAIVTDGPWDMGKFFQMQCLVSGLPAVPHDLRYWINLRRAYANTYRDELGFGKNPIEWRNLNGMLSGLRMTFEGREHSGKDDAKNIARIAIRMLQDGRELRINEKLMRRDRAIKELTRRTEEMERRRAERGEKEERKVKEEPTAEDKERAVWRDYLPYKVIAVSKQEFLMDSYSECETCSEGEAPSESEADE